MSIKETYRDYRNLPGPIWALAAARLVNSAGSFVFPFLTLLLTDRLGYNAEDAGRILMITTVLFVPGSLLGGWLADKVGRKRLLVGAQIVSALSLAAIGFMAMTPSIIYLILIHQFFIGLMVPSSSAATYDLTDSSNRKTAFSLLYLAMNLGFAAGPFLAGYLYEGHARWLFFGDAVTTLISLVFVVVFLPETLSLAMKKSSECLEKTEEGSTIRLILRRPVLLGFVILMAVPWFIYGQHSFTLPMFVKYHFPQDGAFLYGKAMSLNALIVVALTVPIIRMTRRLKPVVSVAAHAAFYAVGFGMLAYFASPAAIYISVLIWTVGEILGATNIEVFTANHTPSSHRGRFTSILPLISGSGRAFSPWLTGMLLLTRPLKDAWRLCFILGAASALGFLLIGVYDREHMKR
ncbi:MAG: MFS transporter [Spirochaetaceae bacterium]|nr:MFS transporter [Spirochaetaceae bacterium]MDT8298591.1 MFS transporter [Spirochaetaceae bacterium]